MKELIKNIENWAEERNLIQGSAPQKQFIKLMEEFGELCAGISKNKNDMIIDSIGDCVVVFVILCKQTECSTHILKMAFDQAHYSVTKDNCDRICIRIAYALRGLSEIFMNSKFRDYDKKVFYSSIFEATYLLGLLSKDIDVCIEFCVKKAWNEIKDRKGKMINGVFVKEADL
ncbi:MazG-like family protein [Aggregatibacter actinomycetemcomitans]|uniref:MazG-like family protein n=1 Tax=Aggregatibacter actinomycetemcomitans TaxID=714 RepID=UPI00197B7DBE|nr:MazG-like family protein [Aggregatibacter actinomycetemcomitans]MBN6079926.1 pyrophosphatase [Aggregatibacter actinomycetemcomitans]